MAGKNRPILYIAPLQMLYIERSNMEDKHNMVRTIIHGARMGGGGGGVQMGFSIPVSNFYLIAVDRGCWFYHHAVKFFW